MQLRLLGVRSVGAVDFALSKLRRTFGRPSDGVSAVPQTPLKGGFFSKKAPLKNPRKSITLFARL